MTWRTWIPLVVALAFGLVAAKFGRDAILRAGANGAAQGRFSRIVIATRDIEPGTELTAQDVKLGTIAAENLPRTAFGDCAKVVGRVAVTPMAKDQAVLEPMLAGRGAGAGAAALVPPGLRAVTVEVNEATGLAGLLTPGCRVDVVATLQDDAGRRSIARTVVQNARVMAVGRMLVARGEDGEKTAPKSVTLLVSPHDAEAIELASHSGRTRLALRSLLDGGSTDTEGATVAELLGLPEPQKEAAAVIPPTTRPAEPVIVQAPPKVVPRKHVIEVINGADLTRVEFELPPEVPGGALTDTGTERAIPGDRSP